MYDFKRHFFMHEGGAAAQRLVDELSLNYGKQLQYIRVPRARLPEIAPIIDNIIAHLKKQKFIIDEPKYTLGSTRLAAHIMGKQVPMQPVEEPEVVQQAIQKKETFGDIDLDIELMPNRTIREVGEYFKKLDLTAYAYMPFRKKEINMAVRINDTEVIQIDIVDVLGTRPSIEYSQFSSLKDMSLGLKGVLREVLVRSVARSTPLRNEAELTQLVNTSQDMQRTMDEEGTNARTKKKDTKVEVDKIRYSLGEDGLKVIVLLKKTKLKTGKVNKIPVRYDLGSLITHELTKPTGYHNLNLIADILGFSSGNVLYHVSEMIKEIHHFSPERKQEIWNSMAKILITKLPRVTATGTIGGQLSQEEANQALEFFKPYFQGVDYDAWQKDKEEV